MENQRWRKENGEERNLASGDISLRDGICLLVVSEKLRLVLACSGVVPWDALRRAWEDGAMGSHNPDAAYTHHGGNVPFQYQNRSMKCMHRISLNQGFTNMVVVMPVT